MLVIQFTQISCQDSHATQHDQPWQLFDSSDLHSPEGLGRLQTRPWLDDARVRGRTRGTDGRIQTLTSKVSPKTERRCVEAQRLTKWNRFSDWRDALV